MSWTSATIPNLNDGEVGYSDGTHFIAVTFKATTDVKAYLESIGFKGSVSVQNDKSLFDFFGIGRQIDDQGKPVLDGDGNPVIETHHQYCGPISEFIGNASAVSQQKVLCLAKVQAEFDGLLNAAALYSDL